jgi:hypothetical protein
MAVAARTRPRQCGSEELRAYSPSPTIIDSIADGRDALVVGRGVVAQRSCFVATVLQALEQAATWSRAHPVLASKLLARARENLDRALSSAPQRQRTRRERRERVPLGFRATIEGNRPMRSRALPCLMMGPMPGPAERFWPLSDEENLVLIGLRQHLAFLLDP